MIRGVVDSRRVAHVQLWVRGPAGAELDVDTLVDSGFTSSLALPAATVAALGLARRRGGTGVLADGSIHQFDIYSAEVAWDGGWRPVLVYATGDAPLLGMRLMAGHRLQIDVVPGGAVEIAQLP